MSKKKKIANVWDIPAEEQQKYLDEIYQAEQSGVFSITKVSKGLNESGLTSDIEARLIAEMSGVTFTEAEEHRVTVDVSEMHPSVDPSKFNMNMPTSEPSELSTTHEVQEKYTEESPCRKVSFRIIDDLNRLVINDGIAPTTYSYDIGLNQELAVSVDPSDMADKVSLLFHYILTLKHPTAIFTEDEFADKFEHLISYDEDRYYFFTIPGYVLVYIVDARSYTAFLNQFSNMEYDAKEVMTTYVSLSLACGTLHQAFFVEDTGYVRYLYDSILNSKEKFYNDIKIDPKTVINMDAEGDLTCTDVVELQRISRDIISTLTGDTFDDEDYDDDDDDELVETSVPAPVVVTQVEDTTTVTINNKTTVTEAQKTHEEIMASMQKELFSDGVEIIDVPEEQAVVEAKPSPKPITSVPTSDDFDDMKIPVIRK